MVISAAGMAIYLLCGGCKGQDMSDAERNMENENASEDEAIAETEDSSTVDYHTCPSGTVVDKALSEAEIDELVEKKFEGSLPAFIAAFTKCRKVSDSEVEEIQKMIDRYRKGGT